MNKCHWSFTSPFSSLFKNLSLYIFTIFISLYSVNGAAVPLFRTDVVLFSPIQGKLTYQGKPAANAKIVRHLTWKDDAGETESFYTDNSGEFILPERVEKVRIPMLGEFRVVQQLDVFYKEQEFLIWAKGTDQIDKYGGLGGPLTNLTCELTDEFEKDYEFQGLFGTSCVVDLIDEKRSYDEENKC